MSTTKIISVSANGYHSGVPSEKDVMEEYTWRGFTLHSKGMSKVMRRLTSFLVGDNIMKHAVK